MSIEEVQSSVDTILALQLASGSSSVKLLDTKAKIDPIAPKDKVLVEMSFDNKAIINTIYLKATNDKVLFNAMISNSSDDTSPEYVLEYRTINNSGICYDILDIPYIDSMNNMKVYLWIENTSDTESLEFDLIRIRGIKM